MRAWFQVRGLPKGQPRPRAFVRGGKARVHDPSTAEGWKSAVVAAGAEHRPTSPIEGPIVVELEFFMPRPARLLRKKDPAEAIPHTAKPDIDNLTKAVLDALTHDGWWRDDSQVIKLEVSKYYAPKDEHAGASVYIEQWTP